MNQTFTIDSAVQNMLFHMRNEEQFVIDHDYLALPSTQKIIYKIGKGTRKFVNFLKLPETKAAVLFANWALSATLLIMTALFAATPAVMFAALALFLIETYAVFGVAEYAIAYSIANRIVKAA
jgi:hypothetical protein